MKCPEITSSIVIADDAELAAICSSYLIEKSNYLAVLDGPRMTRDDREAEVIRRHNVVARIQPTRVILAGLPEESVFQFSKRFPASLITKIDSKEDALVEFGALKANDCPKLVWGTKNIGIGLLEALRANAAISFVKGAECSSELPTKSGHLVICEAGEPVSEVIAANYAYALRAGLKIIPKVAKTVSEEILEGFYSLYDQTNSTMSPSKYLDELRMRIRGLCGPIDMSGVSSLTFISKEIPYGFAFSEVPSTHLFTYPDLGLSVANGFVAEQRGSRGTNVSVLVDPEQTPAPEVETISKRMIEKKALVRGYSGKAVTVARIADLVELFPYNLLFFATHCGDAPGFRWTYEYSDSSQLTRRLVVDIALGVGGSNEKDLLNVTEYQRFHELDGVDWRDPEKSNKVEVGTAISDFIELRRTDDDFKPIKKEDLDRVLGSAALKMADNNYIPVFSSVASNGTPIIINNACSSWQNLASRFVFAGCRCYVGTLFPVSTVEANEVMTNIFGKQWGKSIPHAIWSAQNAVYGDSQRRPYIVTGVFCSKLRITREDVPLHLLNEFNNGLQASIEFKKIAEKSGEKYQTKRANDQIGFYESELESLRERYLVSYSG